MSDHLKVRQFATPAAVIQELGSDVLSNDASRFLKVRKTMTVTGADVEREFKKRKKTLYTEAHDRAWEDVMRRFTITARYSSPDTDITRFVFRDEKEGYLVGRYVNDKTM